MTKALFGRDPRCAHEPMKSILSIKIRWLAALALAGVLSILFAAQAGSFLIIDSPSAADVILVLAGETDQRPRRAIDLLTQGYAKEVVIDVPANARVYKFTELELAQSYIDGLPQAHAIRICPIIGLSTKTESKDAEKCLQNEGAKKVLIVTSDFHTRRSLDVFRHELPEFEFAVAAARSPENFGAHWWTHRQWAKTFVDEWLRLLWWHLVDRWR